MEERRAVLLAGLAQETSPPPAMHPNLAQAYRDKVARLREALQGPDSTDALEAAGELIEQVIVSPPERDDDPPGIEVVGEFVAMLKAAGLGTKTRKNQAENSNVLRLFATTVKRGSRAKAPKLASRRAAPHRIGYQPGRVLARRAAVAAGSMLVPSGPITTP